MRERQPKFDPVERLQQLADGIQTDAAISEEQRDTLLRLASNIHAIPEYDSAGQDTEEVHYEYVYLDQNRNTEQPVSPDLVVKLQDILGEQEVQSVNLNTDDWEKIIDDVHARAGYTPERLIYIHGFNRQEAALIFDALQENGEVSKQFNERMGTYAVLDPDGRYMSPIERQRWELTHRSLGQRALGSVGTYFGHRLNFTKDVTKKLRGKDQVAGPSKHDIETKAAEDEALWQADRPVRRLHISSDAPEHVFTQVSYRGNIPSSAMLPIFAEGEVERARAARAAARNETSSQT